MRYSMLVYITKMSRTLLEAAQYLRTGPEEALAAELLDTGVQMLTQIWEVLEAHREDLRSALPLDKLAEIETSWQAQNSGLEEKLEQFIQCLSTDISYQVRAVFFAELGEKWDAMESVYTYMRDDPRFDPVVVRTPVGRAVDRDGKQEQEIIYKDFLTSMGIPSLGYDQYDIEEDCPELAFISQPYESCTLEQFWPENIAKHTRLVYLPYFLPFLILEEHKQTLCQLPVYRHAWKVIGASDRHYRFYRKYAANGGGNMLVTGLPKLDSIVHLHDEPTAMPDEWKTRLDGRNPILWNTWYDYPMSSLSYFEPIIKWFQTHQDCALIWRPHPMTKTVTKLYYPPESYDRLQRCEETIHQMANAVYDQETSCNAAFSCSVAQISDYSSLMPQYLPLNKPLLWIKNERNTSIFPKGKMDFIVDWKWMEAAADSESILRFLERIRQGIDENSKIRQEIFQRDMSLTDGYAGERVCEELWKAMHREDFSKGAV